MVTPQTNEGNYKFDPKFEPGAVIKQTGPTTYLVSRPQRARKRTAVVNVDRLKPRRPANEKDDEEDMTGTEPRDVLEASASQPDKALPLRAEASADKPGKALSLQASAHKPSKALTIRADTPAIELGEALALQASANRPSKTLTPQASAVRPNKTLSILLSLLSPEILFWLLEHGYSLTTGFLRPNRGVPRPAHLPRRGPRAPRQQAQRRPSAPSSPGGSSQGERPPRPKPKGKKLPRAMARIASTLKQFKLLSGRLRSQNKTLSGTTPRGEEHSPPLEDSTDSTSESFHSADSS